MGTLAVLADDVRRDLYFHVRSAANPISRDEAAELAGVSRNLAAFHLEKLVAAGLLTITQGRTPRLRRPGRAPKLYSLTDTQIEFSLPQRRYDTMAAMLVEAVHVGGETVRGPALRAAHSRGTGIGATALGPAKRGRLGVERALGLLRPVLEEQGYEPEISREGSVEVRLRNCPFHGLLDTDRALVCSLNCELVAGILDGLGVEVLEAHLMPRPDHCCVTVAPRGRGIEPNPTSSEDGDAVK